MAIDLRPLTADDLPAARDLLATLFHDPRARTDPEHAWQTSSLDRSVAAFDDGRLVACGRSYPFEMSVPGGAAVTVAGVTWIGVAPSHRRRGLLRLMLDVLHDQARERGEPALALHASEGAIYGRFGYGVATRRRELTIATSASAFRPEATLAAPGTTRLVDLAAARGAFPRAHDRAWPDRPGALRRPPDWWDEEFFTTVDDGVSRTFALHEDAAGEPDGFVAVEVKGSWERGVARYRAEVGDLVGSTPGVRAALWRFVLDLDLVEGVRAFNVPVDEPLEWMLVDGRQIATDGIVDELWLRVLDVPALLGARTFGPGRVVIDVRDTESDGADRATGPAHGRWSVGGDGGPACEASRQSPDLTCGARELAATLLGGVAWTTLVRAGLVGEHRSGAAARADAVFATIPAPHAGTWF